MPRTLVVPLGSPARSVFAFLVGLTVLSIGGCKQTGGPQSSFGVPSVSAGEVVTVTAAGTGVYSVDFGSVPVGQQASAELLLSNTGTSPLQILGVDVVSDPQFSITLSSGTNIGQGEQIKIPMVFKPFSTGDKKASVVIHTDSASVTDVTLNLHGVGVALKLGVDPAMLDFGTVVVHTTLTKSVTLTNNSELDLQITPGAIQGNNPDLFSLAQTTVFTLPAGQSAQIDVTYAPLVSSTMDTAYFTLAPNIGNPVTVTLQGTGAQNALQVSPMIMDFSFVQPGQQRTIPLHLHNIGNLAVNISSIAVTVTDQGFALDTGAPQSMSLAGGQQVDVNVVFSPINTRHYDGQLQVISDDTLGQVTVVLKGYGGGAAISCAPPALDFGVAPTNITTTLPVICTNTGTDVMVGGQKDPLAKLTITDLVIQGPNGGVFSAVIDPKAPQGPLEAQQSTQIDVSYLPVITENDAATLTIKSNVMTPPAPPVLSLAGQGVAEGKCYYSLQPSSLNFGQVKPGTTTPYLESFIITNTGPNECLVNAVSLQAGSDPVFSLPNGVVVSQRLSPPGVGEPFPNSLTVPVAFAPKVAGSFAGSVGFTISDPAAPNVLVPLSGVGGTSCFIIKPTNLNFGVVGLSNGMYCANGKKSFVGVNGCPGDVTIQSITLAAQGSTNPFAFISGTVPVTIASGQSSPPFQVGFKPTAAGAYYGSAQVQTDLQQTPFGVFFQGTAATGSQNTDIFKGHTPKVDVLLVMDTDDDLQMRTEFATHVPDFVKAAEDLNLDFQIGVTTTSDCPSAQPAGEQGRLIPCPGCNVPGPAPTVITQDDANAASDVQTLVLINNLASDMCPVITDDEHYFDVAYKALVYGPPPAPSWNINAGLVREDAYLSVIQTNGDDEDAADPQTPQWYANQFLSIKGTDHPELFSWSYINPSQYGAPGGHQPFDRLPAHIRSMLELVGGVALDYTQPKWWQGVIDLWNIVLQSTTKLPLSGTPDPTSIQVYFDGPPPDQTPPGGVPGVLIQPTQPNGSRNWTYDSLSNTLDIGTTLTLSSSDTLYVVYNLVCD